MIVDTSALIAILRDEADGPAILRALHENRPRRLSAASYLEAAVVIDRSLDPIVRSRLDEILAELEIVIEPVTPEQARIARQAYREFGKGSSHPAGLNFGDCFVYALAKEAGEPLLYKGTDFAQTDIPFVGSREERRRLSEALAGYAAG